MYFTKTSDTFRGWFQLVRSSGDLRVNSLSSSFTAVVVNENDTASISPVVTQSQQKPGLYYFDITSSFFATHGVGSYGISIEVNETSSPIIKSAFSEVIKLSQNDFDSITAVVDVDAIVSGVWSAQTSSFNVSGSFGQSLAIADFNTITLKLCEIHQILGLESGSPMTVTTTERTVSAITQSITGDASTSVTVTRL